MNWSLATKSLLSPTLASRSGDPSPPPRRRRTTASPSTPPPRRLRKQPSVAEVQRAIGVVDDDPMRGMRPDSSSGSPAPPSMLDLLSLTPIGQAERPVERKIRELAEWVVDQTEANAKAGQQILLVVCLKILPVWLLLLLVASGVIKLPFDLPFMDDLFS